MELTSYATILGVGSLIVGAGVYLYGTARKGRIDYLRIDNDELRKSNGDRDVKIAGLEATVVEQSRQIADLQAVATQTPAVTQLIAATNSQQKLMIKQHTDVIKEISNLAKALSELTMEFSRVAYVMSANTVAQDKNTKSRSE